MHWRRKTYVAIQIKFFKIEQKDMRCVKCGHKWTYLATTGHIAPFLASLHLLGILIVM